MPNNIQKTNRHTMDFIRRMRRSAISAGRPDGLIREIAWKAGKLRGNMRVTDIFQGCL